MAECSSYDVRRFELVGAIMDAMYGALVGKVIAEIKDLPDNCRQSGDDSQLKDVWEEFKYQMQVEQSVFFDFYQDTIQDMCRRLVETLDQERLQLLWLWSEGYGEQWVDKDKVSLDDFDGAAVVAELYDRVCDAAGNEDLDVDSDEDQDADPDEEDADSDGAPGTSSSETDAAEQPPPGPADEPPRERRQSSLFGEEE